MCYTHKLLYPELGYDSCEDGQGFYTMESLVQSGEY